MNELADRILYSKSGFTRVVDRMEEAGLVRRVRPQHDRRSILVLLTDKGTKTMEPPAATTETASAALLSPLTDADITALTRTLEKIASQARSSASLPMGPRWS